MSKDSSQHTQSQSCPKVASSILPGGSAWTELTTHPSTAGGGAREALASHTCLTINNSITETNKGIPLYTDEEKNKEYEFYKDKIEPRLNSTVYKHSQRMQFTIEQVAFKHGRESIGVMELTLPNDEKGNQPTFDHANRCLNSFLTNIGQKRYGNNYLVVCERGGQYGRVHFHILFVLQGADFFTGSFKRKQGKRDMFYPNEDCRKEFKFLQSKAPNYGFGKFTRVSPLWDVSKGSRYFSKYVGKGHYGRNEEMKGRQLIRYGKGFQRYHTGINKTLQLPDGSFYRGAGFTKCNGAGRDRREVYQMLGSRYGVNGDDKREFAEIFGSKWEYYSGDQMRFMCAVSRKRLLPKTTIEWLQGYLWNKFKLKLIHQRRGKFYYEVFGAYKYMIKGSEARNWVGRSSAAPDCVHEQTALMTFENMRKYAWRNLCAKVESDAMGDKLFNDLPVVDGLFNLKQDNKNETKHTTNEQDGRHSRTSIEPNGQLEIDGDFY
jgi:hypothetical protein